MWTTRRRYCAQRLKLESRRKTSSPELLMQWHERSTHFQYPLNDHEPNLIENQHYCRVSDWRSWTWSTLAFRVRNLEFKQQPISPLHDQMHVDDEDEVAKADTILSIGLNSRAGSQQRQVMQNLQTSSTTHRPRSTLFQNPNRAKSFLPSNDGYWY